MALTCVVAPFRRMQAFEVKQDNKRVPRRITWLHELGESLAVIGLAETPAIPDGGEGPRELGCETMRGGETRDPDQRLGQALHQRGNLILHLVCELWRAQPMGNRKPHREIAAAEADQPPCAGRDDVGLEIVDELEIGGPCLR